MGYVIDVLDGERTRTAELTGLTAASLFERVNAPARITAETIDDEKWRFIEPGRSFLRVRAEGESVGSIFRVLETRMERERERPTLKIHARHLMGDASDEIFAASVNCVNRTPAQLAALALEYSAFRLGTAEMEGTIPFMKFEYEPVLDCLLRICAVTGGELSLDEETGEISILKRIGADNGAVFRYGFNLRSVSRTVDISRLENRVYGAGGGNPLLDMRGAGTGGGLPYVEDAESIARWGLREAACHEPSLEDVTNLVSAPALDGAYSEGLCEGWENNGAETSCNEDPSYYLYGSVSQRARTWAPGQGISQAVTVTPGRIYSLLAYVFVVSGAVRVQAEDGPAVYRRTGAAAAAGLSTARVENWKAITPSVTVKIIQEGEGAAEFYVAGAQVAEGARVKPFTAGKSADALRDRALERLNAHREPDITYEIELADRSGEPGMEGTAHRFGLGDTVTVIDPTIELRIKARVMEREADLLRTNRVRVRLDTPGRRLPDILASIRKSQDEGMKHIRKVLEESAAAAEAGSLRLGFSSRTVRFTGVITATGWNSFTWSGGTLRTGDAWFSLDEGSVSGLAEDSVYFCFFDRTAPEAFGYSPSPAQAEGEDRVPVFTVVTTTSPSPCSIHPPEVIGR